MIKSEQLNYPQHILKCHIKRWITLLPFYMPFKPLTNPEIQELRSLQRINRSQTLNKTRSNQGVARNKPKSIYKESVTRSSLFSVNILLKGRRRGASSVLSRNIARDGGQIVLCGWRRSCCFGRKGAKWEFDSERY